jgi:hypothetical protein
MAFEPRAVSQQDQPKTRIILVLTGTSMGVKLKLSKKKAMRLA